MQSHNIEGRVILLGTPAEESGGGKAHLLDKQACESADGADLTVFPDVGMDVCMMVHPGQTQVGHALIAPTLAVQSFEVEFHGVSSRLKTSSQRLRNLPTRRVRLGMASTPWMPPLWHMPRSIP
jgi:metal-dependent amidase/aminoacylase/carboxypeptidase family protein